MKTLYFTTLFLTALCLGAQELPPIQNYATFDYGAETQNWAISQSKEGYLYFGNNSGLLQYDGEGWKTYYTTNRSVIRSVKAKGDLIYTGCYMEFGYWETNALGDRVYRSLLDKLETPLVEDEEFWNILILDQYIFFQSLHRIYIYDTDTETFNIIDAPSTRARIFELGGTVFFQRSGEGLFKIEDGGATEVSTHPLLRSNTIIGLFEIRDKPLLLLENGTFFFWEDGHLSPWKIPASDQLESLTIYSGLQLMDGSIIMGTIADGIYHLDAEGTILHHINQGAGLGNNTILSIYEDREQNLWLGLDNGISVVNLNSFFEEYVDKMGTLGVVYAATIFDGYLYLGTNQGLFFKPADTTGDFEFIENTNGQVWALNVIGNTLFCGHNEGTFTVKGGKAKLISDFPGSWGVKKIADRPDLLLQGNYGGLSILHKDGDGWTLRNTIEGFDISSRFFEFTKNGEILVNHEYKGIFTLELDPDFQKVVEIDEKPPNGMGASLVKFQDDILFMSHLGVFDYEADSKTFVKDSVFTANLFSEEERPIGILMADASADRLWCFTNVNIQYLSPGNFNERQQRVQIPIPEAFRRNLGPLGFECLIPLSDDKYLIGISNGFITLDLKKLEEKVYNIRLNSVALKTDDPEVAVSLPIAEKGEFEAGQNSIEFTYSIPEYAKYLESNYQYQLEGLHSNWQTWTLGSKAVFEKLSSGDYVFKVRAKTGNQLSENIASYAFTIAKPWYFSKIMIAVYAICCCLLFYMVHRVSRDYYKKQQARLEKESARELEHKRAEAEREIMRVMNEKLEQEIKGKSRELAISTMSLIKKNKFLNAIKEELKGVEDPKVKSVIRTIDRNINHADDWKFFEDAFNNADSEFLKKIKTKHPELTSNDLRLCAYLRLNLTSKEIAPLLNITVRSVDVKRYRLRKKIGLSHDDGLTEYILSI
ncbi:triple tyrosine motif-containing protein [Zobellia uliginosa]|uniref:triple tyrosine motif-containing protein n=1 Tax=Zobellia uliginosa TaxID=143224 RepID=UPI0026E2CB5C|nr:triple tyrosine motif-containing protein [Zobellia uliginosa]MDO6519531.1 triple tyrosine motif-containing protein [Zobellia uliginosa]